ncbi:MAG: ATP-binding protein [Bacillota bacterium]|nr:ATP-binding protein [Bacillota bacterium]
MQFPAKAIYENLIFTTTGEVFALYRFFGVSYDFLPEQDKKSLIYGLNSIFYGYEGRGQILFLTEELWCDALTYCRDLPLSREPRLREEARRHVDTAVGSLVANRAQARRSYLCIRLPVVAEGLFSIREFRDSVLEAWAALRKPAQIPKRVLEDAMRAEGEMYNHLSQLVSLGRADAEDFVFIVRRAVQRYGILPERPAWGERIALSEGTVTAITEGAVLDPHLRYVTVRMDDQELHEVFITLADVPRSITHLDKEWLALLDRRLDFPVDAVVHFRTYLPEKAKKKLAARRGMLAEQLEEHYSAAGEAPRKQEWAAQIAGDLEARLEDGMPLLEFAAVFAVAGRTVQEMRSYAKVLLQMYTPAGFKACIPPGDQLKCLYGFFPGAPFGRHLPAIVADPGYIASSVPMARQEVGDGRGFVLGWNGKFPVFFLPGLAMQSGSGGIGIVGTQGGGKSMAGKTITYLCGLCDARAFVIDPKDECQQFFKLPFTAWKIDLSAGGRARVNPFALSPDPRRAASIAKDFLDVLLEAHKDRHAARRLLINQAVQKVASEPPERRNMYTLLEVLDDLAGAVRGGVLEADEIQEARFCARILRIAQQNALGQIIFGNEDVLLSGREQITIVNLKELPLPRPGVQDAYSQLTESEKIAVALLFLVASAAREAMFRVEKERLKVIFLDESSHLLRVPAGFRLIDDLTSISRSFNIHPILLLQNPSDLDERIINNLGYLFAFRMKSLAEAQAACRALGIEDEEVPEEMGRLPDGFAYMRDTVGRIARVQIAPYPEYLLDVFDTRPAGGRKEAS